MIPFCWSTGYVFSSFDDSTPFTHLQFDVHRNPHILFTKAAQTAPFLVVMFRCLFEELKNFALFLIELNDTLLSPVPNLSVTFWKEACCSVCGELLLIWCLLQVPYLIIQVNDEDSEKIYPTIIPCCTRLVSDCKMMSETLIIPVCATLITHKFSCCSRN